MEVTFSVRHSTSSLLTAEEVEDEVRYVLDQIPVYPEWVAVGEEQELDADRCGDESQASFQREVTVCLWADTPLPGGVQTLAAAVVTEGSAAGISALEDSAEPPGQGSSLTPYLSRTAALSDQALLPLRRSLWIDISHQGFRRRSQRSRPARWAAGQSPAGQ